MVMQTGNPFYVKQGPGYAPGLQGLAETIGKENEQRRLQAEQQAQEQQKQARQRQMQTDFMSAYQSNDTEQMFAVMAKYPELSDVVSKSMQHKNETTKKNFSDMLMDIMIDPSPENVAKVLQNRRDVLDGQGVTNAGRQQFNKFVKDIEGRTPEEIKKAVELTYLANFGVDKFKAYKEATALKGDDVKVTTDITNFNKWQELKKTDPVAAKAFGKKVGFIDKNGKPKDNYMVVDGKLVDISKASPETVIEKDKASSNKEVKVYTDIGKLNSDLKNNLITQDQFDESLARLDKEVIEDKYKGLESGYKTYLSANGLDNTKENYKAYNAFKVDQAEKMRKQKTSRPYLTALTDWVPSTRITEPLLDYYEDKAKAAAEAGTPLTADDMYKIEFEAQHNRALARTKASRLVQQRVQNVEAAFGLLKDMKVTSDKINYSDVKFVGMLEKFKKGQLNDPNFTEYMTQRSDALFILGNALKQNGLTDKAIEVEEEAAAPTMSPTAFNAWVNTQIRALNRSAQELNKAYGFDIETQKAFPPGQGGVSTEESPNPKRPPTPLVVIQSMEKGEIFVGKDGKEYRKK